MRKQYISYIVITILSLTNILNINIVSALSYESNIGVGFTFNPTLSVSISPDDLVISNLVPGSILDSNVINVSVASNASYGYTLSATVGNNSNYNSDSLINSIDSNKVFSNVAVDANLSSLNDSTSTNIWGYSYKDNTVDTPTWSSYNGLPLYSSTNPTTLIDLNSNTSTGTSSLDFKIAAKASTTQPSGAYSNIINFMAVSKVGTVSLLDAFVASNATMQNGYYTMQGMTPAICNAATIGSSLQLLDVRDSKLYWATKLADNNCWMTQNLDLDLDSNRTYTHWDTDLGWNDPNNLDTNATWQPDNSTINFTIDSTISNWADSAINPYSANPGNVYFYTSNSDIDDIQYNSLRECVNAGHNDCTHYHAGNYYNWSAAVASNDTSELVENCGSAPDSVCPRGWKLPNRTRNSTNGFIDLLFSQGIIQSKASSPYAYNQNGFNSIRTTPLYFTRAGNVINRSLSGSRLTGYYWTSTARTTNNLAFYLIFNPDDVSFISNYGRTYGRSLRCLAR